MPKVLHILEYSVPKFIGYTIRSKYIVENQAAIGIEPFVITSPLHGFTQRSPHDPEIIRDIKYYRTGCYNRMQMNAILPLRLAQRYKFSREYRKSIIAVAQTEQVQILHAHSSYLNGVRGAQAGKHLKLPVVYEVRGLWQDTAIAGDKISTGDWRYKFIEWMELKAMRAATMVVVISEQLKEDLQAKGIPPEKIFIVPNGVDTAGFIPVEKNLSLLREYGLTGKMIIGFIGSVTKIEGLDFVIKNFKQVLDRNPSVRLMIVGGGTEIDFLKQTAREREVEPYVIFTGQVPHDQVQGYYGVMDIMIYPRINSKVNQKVTPLKPLEAMAMQKAVLASDVGGLAELVKDGENGVLFHADKADSFIRKVMDLIERPDYIRALGESARRWVARERDWCQIIKRYENLYNQLL